MSSETRKALDLLGLERWLWLTKNRAETDLETNKLAVCKAHFTNYYPKLPIQRIQGLNDNLGRPLNFELLFLLRQATSVTNFLKGQFEFQFNIQTHS